MSAYPLESVVEWSISLGKYVRIAQARVNFDYNFSG